MTDNPIGQSYYAHGKLLLSGEYFVLDGAQALAIPTKFGQSLNIKRKEEGTEISWESMDYTEQLWFESKYALSTLEQISTSDKEISERLSIILNHIKKSKPALFEESMHMETKLEFPRAWGLGTSSTLIYMLAKWAKVDMFDLLKNTFGGSGYDLACAGEDGPIIYQRWDGHADWRNVVFEPDFQHSIYFVHLGNKMNSREAIKNYRKLNINPSILEEVSSLSNAMLYAEDLAEFNRVIQDHEKLVSRVLGVEKVADKHFPDFKGAVKSLGAWGGDFVMVTNPYPCELDLMTYFKSRGYETIKNWDSMVL